MRVTYHISSQLFVLVALNLHRLKGEYTCNSDWKLVGDTCIGHFKKTDEKATWHVARDKCRRLNSTLATIRSANKQSLIKSVFTGDAWIDLLKDSSSNEFRWASGDPKVNFKIWQTGQPNNGGEGCAVMLFGYTRGHWADKPCFNKYYYICEAGSGARGCADGMAELAGKCYSFSNRTATWYDAREACKGLKGDLLVVENALKNEIIRSTMEKNSQWRYRTFWMGATDVLEEGKWRWLDNTQEMTYQNWSSGSPDNGGNSIHSCVYMPSTYRSNGAWKTQNCNVFYPSVCETIPTFGTINGSGSCAENWKLYRNETCIGLITQTATWEGSRKRCKQLGGDLVVVTDSSKSSFVRRSVVNRHRGRTGWIGLRDKNLDGEWSWLDAAEKTTFRDWYSGYPRENLMRKLDCVFMRGSSYSKGKWANALCTMQTAYICEMMQSSGLPCDMGWASYGGHCYKFNYDISNWNDARARCRLQNANSDLAVVDNLNEQIWLQGKTNPLADVDGFWIGLNSKQQKNFFVWLNSSASASWVNWDAGMPSYMKKESCALSTGGYRNAEWTDEECMEKNAYLCEKPAEGDASYYDFRYNSSIYKVLLARFTPEHGDEYCKKILGVNSTLILFEGKDEMEHIRRELDARGLAGSKRYWTKGNVDNTPNEIQPTPRTTSSGTSSPEYASRNCFQLWFESYGPWQSRSYRAKLRSTACCQEYQIICEKHIDPNIQFENKYDFALNSSIYRLVDKEMLSHDAADSKCSELLDNSGSLAEFETWEELEAVSREVLARHIGEHFVYWVKGDPLDENTTSVAPKITFGGESHCLTLDYDPAKLKTTFDPTMTLKPTACTGNRKFLCEQKGIDTNIDDVKSSIYQHFVKYANDDEYRQKFVGGSSGCVGPCIGLAVALPFVAIGAFLIAVAYFWFIRRQSPFNVKFSRHEDDEVRLTM